MQRRMLEGEIHSSAEKVQELLTELQNQRIEEQIAKTRGDIYASIIHDINGPLTVISGFVQVLNQRLNRTARMELEDLEFIKDRLRIIARQVGNCIEISRRYLGFLRRQSDEHAPRVSVNQLLKDLEQLMRVHPSVQENEFSITPLAEDIGRQNQRHRPDPDFAESHRERLSMRAAEASCGNWRRNAAHAAGSLQVQGQPARPAAERRKRGQHTARWSNSGCATTVRAFRRKCCRKFSSLTSPPRVRAREPASASASFSGSSRKATARCMSTPDPAKAPPSRFICPGRIWRNNRNRQGWY